MTENDIVDILRWKTGAIDFNYDNSTITTAWYSIDAHNLIKEIGGQNTGEPVSDIIKKIMDCEKYIGPVYAITLLYFLSQGKYPIYDRFAHIAVKVISE